MTLRPNACAHCLTGALYYDPYEDESCCLACARRVPLRPRVLLDLQPVRDVDTGVVGQRRRASRAVAS